MEADIEFIDSRREGISRSYSDVYTEGEFVIVGKVIPMSIDVRGAGTSRSQGKKVGDDVDEIPVIGEVLENAIDR